MSYEFLVYECCSLVRPCALGVLLIAKTHSSVCLDTFDLEGCTKLLDREKVKNLVWRGVPKLKGQ
jgi:hypothetical protein